MTQASLVVFQMLQSIGISLFKHFWSVVADMSVLGLHYTGIITLVIAVIVVYSLSYTYVTVDQLLAIAHKETSKIEHKVSLRLLTIFPICVG